MKIKDFGREEEREEEWLVSGGFDKKVIIWKVPRDDRD